MSEGPIHKFLKERQPFIKREKFFSSEVPLVDLMSQGILIRDCIRRNEVAKNSRQAEVWLVRQCFMDKLRVSREISEYLICESAKFPNNRITKIHMMSGSGRGEKAIPENYVYCYKTPTEPKGFPYWWIAFEEEEPKPKSDALNIETAKP